MTALCGTPTESSSTELGLCVDGREVARYLSAPDLPGELSPRPYLHPVRTLGGVTVTDARPADHPWHLGVGVALPDVAGTNFWGGPSYRRDRGYEWQDDHGQVRHDRWLERTDTHMLQDLVWAGVAGEVLLREQRRVQVGVVRSPAGCWALAFQFSVTNATDGDLSLGSPGSHGRHNAGYGGFFWRLPTAVPTVPPLAVWSPAGRHVDISGDNHADIDKDPVHGRAAAWLAAAGHAADGRPWSVLLTPGDAATADDPWFVRTTDYPAVGSALAFTEALVMAPGATESRTVLAVVADGILSSAECEALRHELRTWWSGQGVA